MFKRLSPKGPAHRREIVSTVIGLAYAVACLVLFTRFPELFSATFRRFTDPWFVPFIYVMVGTILARLADVIRDEFLFRRSKAYFRYRRWRASEDLRLHTVAV